MFGPDFITVTKVSSQLLNTVNEMIYEMDHI